MTDFQSPMTQAGIADTESRRGAQRAILEFVQILAEWDQQTEQLQVGQSEKVARAGNSGSVRSSLKSGADFIGGAL